MTTSTLSLADFIRARLEEDEAAALAATGEDWEGPSAAGLVNDTWLWDVFAPGIEVDGEYEDVGYGTSEQNANHIARHDPARVLAEVAAKRAIIEEATEADAIERTAADNAGWDGDKYDTAGSAILRHLAAVYCDHADYDERWRP